MLLHWTAIWPHVEIRQQWRKRAEWPDKLSVFSREKKGSHSFYCSLGRIMIHISLPSSPLGIWAIGAGKEESCVLGRYSKIFQDIPRYSKTTGQIRRVIHVRNYGKFVLVWVQLRKIKARLDTMFFKCLWTGSSLPA